MQYSLLVIFYEVISHEAFVFVWEGGTFNLFMLVEMGTVRGPCSSCSLEFQERSYRVARPLLCQVALQGLMVLCCIPHPKDGSEVFHSPSVFVALLRNGKSIKSCIGILNEAETEWTLTFWADYQINR